MELNLDQIDKAPIIIVSAPRSGSTFVANYIAEKKNYKLFNQPAKDAPSLHRFSLYDMQSKDYVLKEHALSLKKYMNDALHQYSYKIRIRRKDLFKQVLSHYISSSRKKFIFHKGEEFVNDTIPLDEHTLLRYLEFIKMHNMETDFFPYHIDMELYYEDLVFPESKIVPTIRPLNNDELTDWAYNILKDKL